MRIDNKGAWKPGTYDNLDVVTLGGSSYMCVQDGTTTEPTTLQGWEVLAAKGDTGLQGDRGEKGEKGEKGDRGEKGDTGLQGTQGIQGVKGDPFTYADFTQDQIAELQRPATEAATRADKATKDAQAAIAEVKATEAKLYPAAENILKGAVNDTFVHINDAFAGGALREITIEGACRQDGIPSPDNPVPIEVIEHPVLQLTGKNLLKYPFAFSHPNRETISGITYTDNGDSSISMEGTSTSASFYNLDFTSNAKQFIGKTISIQDIANKDINFTVGFFFEDGSYATVLTTKGNIFKAKVPEKVTLQRVYIGVGANITVNETIRPYIYFEDDDEFTEYTSQERAFTLPVEHPYLAKLPDGTADEIKVDRDGNVELVARVIRNTLTSWSNTANYFICIISPKRANNSVLCTGGVKTSGKQAPGDIFVGAALDRVAYLPREGDTLAALNAKGLVFYYKLVTPNRYPLGKIEMPKVQDGVINAWTDAEVTPKTGIEYTRDVNIVVSNLEKAIASITEG